MWALSARKIHFSVIYPETRKVSFPIFWSVATLLTISVLKYRGKPHCVKPSAWWDITYSQWADKHSSCTKHDGLIGSSFLQTCFSSETTLKCAWHFNPSIRTWDTCARTNQSSKQHPCSKWGLALCCQFMLGLGGMSHNEMNVGLMARAKAPSSIISTYVTARHLTSLRHLSVESREVD